MNLGEVVQGLKAERDRLTTAIQALEEIDAPHTKRGGKRWTEAQRAKFRATMAARRKAKR